MIGILPGPAREIYHVPEGVRPLTALVIGYAGDPAALPENLRPRPLRGVADAVGGGATIA